MCYDLINRNVVLTLIIGYIAGAWAQYNRLRQRAKLRQRVDLTQRGVLIRQVGAFNTTSTETLCVGTGIIPLHLEVVRKEATYWVMKNELRREQEILVVSIITKRDFNEAVNRRGQTLSKRDSLAIIHTKSLCVWERRAYSVEQSSWTVLSGNFSLPLRNIVENLRENTHPRD